MTQLRRGPQSESGGRTAIGSIQCCIQLRCVWPQKPGMSDLHVVQFDEGVLKKKQQRYQQHTHHHHHRQHRHHQPRYRRHLIQHRHLHRHRYRRRRHYHHHLIKTRILVLREYIYII